MSEKKERLKRQATAAKEKQIGEELEAWRDSHSVSCYYCNKEFDEREGENADPYNGGDGGSICPACLSEQRVEA